MISMPHFPDLRVIAGCFLIGALFLLSGCKGSGQPPVPPHAAPPDGMLRFSAAMSFEDRQMMRYYLVQGLHGGLTAIAGMQAKIDFSLDYGCPKIAS
jgi:hypothetical protein